MYFIVYPANDFLIAMGFTAIYFYEGKNEKEEQRKKSQEINPGINYDSDGRTFSELDKMLTDEAKKLVEQEGDNDREKIISKFVDHLSVSNDEIRRS